MGRNDSHAPAAPETSYVSIPLSEGGSGLRTGKARRSEVPARSARLFLLCLLGVTFSLVVLLFAWNLLVLRAAQIGGVAPTIEGGIAAAVVTTAPRVPPPAAAVALGGDARDPGSAPDSGVRSKLKELESEAVEEFEKLVGAKGENDQNRGQGPINARGAEEDAPPTGGLTEEPLLSAGDREDEEGAGHGRDEGAFAAWPAGAREHRDEPATSGPRYRLTVVKNAERPEMLFAADDDRNAVSADGK